MMAGRLHPGASSGGLREAHGHLAAFGQEMSQLDLSGCVSRAECLGRIRDRAAAMRKGAPASWLLAKGVRVAAWDTPEFPTREELDVACPDRPCFIAGFDHHSAAVNTRGLAGVGLTESSPDPPGGIIGRDRRGRPNGLLLEAAFGAARAALPPATREERTAHVRDACAALAALGFTQVHDLLSPPWLGETLAALSAEGSLGLEVWMYPPMDQLDETIALRETWRGTRGVRLAGAKLFADGTLNSRTAAMIEPYAAPLPEHPRGTALLSSEEVRGGLERVRSLGLGLAVHAIGDRAVRIVLDAVSAVGARKDEAPWERVRIEHCEIIDREDVPRFAELGVVASVQPCHLLYDIEVLTEQLPHRLDRVLPIRELLASGLAAGRDLIFGSDVPIVGPDPADSVDAAVHRTRRAGFAGGAARLCSIAPEQAIDEATAWRCFKDD